MRTAVVIGLALAAVVCARPAAANDDCPAGEILVAEDADNYYCLDAKTYRDSGGPKLASQFCATKKKVVADQNAIANLGFSVDVERYEMFSHVAEDQQSELKREVILAMLDQGLTATGGILDSAKSLNPWNVNKAAKMLEEKSFGNAAVVAALKKIASVRDKPEMAAAYQDFEELAKSAVEGYEAGRAIAKEPETAQLQLLVGALKVMQGNYELGLVITGAEFAESAAYLYYINGQTNDLAQQTDEKLSRLSALGTRLKTDVQNLGKASDAWKTVIGVPIAPKCKE